MKKYKWIILVLVIILIGLGVYFSQREEPYVTIWDIKTSSNWITQSVVATRNEKQFVVTGKKQSKKHDEITYSKYAGNKFIFTSRDKNSKGDSESYITIDEIEYGPYSAINDLKVDSVTWDYSYSAKTIDNSGNSQLILVNNWKEIGSYDATKVVNSDMCNGKSIFQISQGGKAFVIINGQEWPQYDKIETFTFSCLSNWNFIYTGVKNNSSNWSENTMVYDYLENNTVVLSTNNKPQPFWKCRNWELTIKDNHFAITFENEKWECKVMVDWRIEVYTYDNINFISYGSNNWTQVLEVYIIEKGYRVRTIVPLNE